MAIGDVDFYPNGGKEQPGCSIEDLDDLFRKMISEGLRTFLSCSHYRAVDYFIESISDSSKCLHMGYECKSYEDFQRGICGHCHDETNLCSEMGFRSIQYFNQMIKKSRNEPIKLFYSTSRQKPYCCKYHWYCISDYSGRNMYFEYQCSLISARFSESFGIISIN